MTVYLCQDSMEGILCGAYDAWTSRLGHANVRLQLENQGNLELFCQYQEAKVDKEKTDKVIQAIKEKISHQAYQLVYKASLGKEEGKADMIYRFLIHGFHLGGRVVDMIQVPAVYEIFRICRYVDNETHLLTGFVRFSQMEGGILFSRIGPRNDVLTLLAPYFADRLPMENWIIYDENRKKAILHPANRPWLVLRQESQAWESRLVPSAQEEAYQSLWKAFCTSISIAGRKNPKCQKNHLPLRYRPYMAEFASTPGFGPGPERVGPG